MSGAEHRLRNEGKCPHCGSPSPNHNAGCPASPSDLPAREAVEDLRTHRESWREALVKARDTADQRLPDTDDKGYWQHELDAFDRTFAALQPLSQGNGEAVAWQRRYRYRIGPDSDDWVWAKWISCSEAEAKSVANNPKSEIRPRNAAPPSQPEGVREALEFAAQTLAEKWVYLTRETSEDDFRWSNDAAVRNIRDEIKSFAQNFTTTPSRGLVEAAEWQRPETAPKDGTEIIVCCVGKEVTDARFHAGRWQSRKEEYPRWTWLNTEEEYGSILGWIPVPVLRSRTLSAKPTAP